MIPWIKEKFTERRARWLAIRSRQQTGNKKSDNTTINDKNELQSIQTAEQSNETSNVDTTITNRTIRIVSPIGTIVTFLFPPNTSGLDVKLKAINAFYKELIEDDRGASSQIVNLNSENFKLIKARIQFVFDENATLHEAQIQDNDELLLLYYRKVNHGISDDFNNIEQLKGPSQLEINRITNYDESTMKKPTIPVVNVNELVLQSDIQYDIRQIVISLAQSSAYIIGIGPYAKRLIEMYKQKLILRRRHEINTLDNLMEMGFHKTAVVQALRLTNDVYTVALDWLIDNQSTRNMPTNELSPNSNASITGQTIVTSGMAANDTKENVQALLEIIRIYCLQFIKPSVEIVQRLKEMGFIEADIHEALKITRNNFSGACEWLLGNREKFRTNSSISDGLAVDSPILKALLASAHVQMSLANPKAFIAYLSILENYGSMNMWLGDGDTAGIIGHILRTYHEEKHILAINQFSDGL